VQKVTNTGDYEGAEVVQVYYGTSQGKLGKPSREVTDFVKIDVLEIGTSQEIALSFPASIMASYAATWNVKLLYKLTELHGEELASKGSHVLLAPSMNILRNPLCSRNFEYFS